MDEELCIKTKQVLTLASQSLNKPKLQAISTYLQPSNSNDFIKHILEFVVAEESLATWLGSLDGERWKTKRSYLINNLKTRFNNYKKYMIVPIPSESTCGRTIQPWRSCHERLMWSHWNYDHKIDKAKIQELAGSLRAKDIDKNKYFNLIFGKNLKLKCMVCHEISRSRDPTEDELLYD